MKSIFIHGFGGAPEHWDDLLAELPSTLRGHVVTLPGHASRAAEPGPFSIEHAAQEIADECRDEPVMLIGHSMGARIATEITHRKPHAVGALVLIDGS